jgi:hypothetical protein
MYWALRPDIQILCGNASVRISNNIGSGTYTNISDIPGILELCNSYIEIFFLVDSSVSTDVKMVHFPHARDRPLRTGQIYLCRKPTRLACRVNGVNLCVHIA